MKRRIFMRGGLAALGSLGLAGCNHFYGGPPGRARGRGRGRGGPPPHAPAHGYRHKDRRSGRDLVFDTGLGVYVVAGLGHYFFDNKFFRWRNDAWQISVNVDGPWDRVEGHRVPSKLYKSKRRGRGRGKDKGRGRGRGRGRDRDDYGRGRGGY